MHNEGRKVRIWKKKFVTKVVKREFVKDWDRRTDAWNFERLRQKNRKYRNIGKTFLLKREIKETKEQELKKETNIQESIFWIKERNKERNKDLES